MKKILIAAASLLMIASVLTSCGRSELRGFKKTKTGLHYKFHVKTDSPKAQIGDIIVAEIWVYIGGELEFSNEGLAEPMFQVMPSQHAGDLMEALKMIGVGDSVTFAFNLDTLRKYNPGMPDDGEKFLLYTIKVDGIYTEEEFEAKMEEDQARGEAEEAEKLQAFIVERGITVKPNNDGVYVVVTTRGTGRQATQGQTIGISYIGRLVDGTVFDTSFEDVAREHNVFTPGRPYSPLEFAVGVGQVIPGMDNALLNMRVGTKATLVIPSNMAYGSHAMAAIPAFSTLVFDIEVLSVK